MMMIMMTMRIIKRRGKRRRRCQGCPRFGSTVLPERSGAEEVGAGEEKEAKGLLLGRYIPFVH
jgi:hypothetical protein